MARKKEKSKDSQFICQNASCRLMFSKPLQVKNLTVKDPRPYEACPRCLTAVTSVEGHPPSEPERSPSGEFPEVEETSGSLEEGKAEPLVGTQCTHHFGYLGERTKSEQIPEDCMVCENLVKCMVKTISG